MVYRRIIEWPNSILGNISRDVKLEKDKKIIKDLLDTFKIVGGYGLSSPQIGYSIRAIVINEHALYRDESSSQALLMINPRILERKEKRTFDEACFSLPSFSFDIERSAEVEVEWTNIEGQKESKRFKDYGSACVQHEIDHLDGILTIDKISQFRRSMIVKKNNKKKTQEKRALGLSSEEKSKQKSLKTRKKNRKNRKVSKK